MTGRKTLFPRIQTSLSCVGKRKKKIQGSGSAIKPTLSIVTAREAPGLEQMCLRNNREGGHRREKRRQGRGGVRAPQA